MGGNRRNKSSWWLLAATLSSAMMGCPSNVVDLGEHQGASSGVGPTGGAGGAITSGSEGVGGGSGLSGGSTGGGTGGSTGSSTGGGTGGSGGGSLCDQDCSLIDTPQCLLAVCNEGQYVGTVGFCVVVDQSYGEPCDDGLFCTIDDSCQQGVCVGGPQNDCGMTSPPCQYIVCDEASQSCQCAGG